MSNVTIQLETLSCPTCIKKIEGALTKTEGVKSAKLLFNASKAKVEYDLDKVTSEGLKSIIEKLGYEVLKVKEA
ncbi:heavy-metal-associated domain-containing protein [Nosocomiicoccus ampullae]|uniref:heavy-metal-associated domain-containing protein n=1 Tax=Nosocomiicoccus ampullae TaxID=489910 RepID=UPI001C5E1058|nr:heavy-metal-associated domain-containing protein [Nosocomiicoccus ampullae]QYA48434.1 cation transporter [Nosocomiicoccus ampullae]